MASLAGTTLEGRLTATPIKAKNWTGGDSRSGTRDITKDITNSSIRAEIQGSMFTDIPKLHEELFPLASLPIAMDDAMALVKSGDEPLYANGQWTGWSQLPDPLPGSSARDEAISHLFNNIIDAVSQLMTSDMASDSITILPRRWSGAFSVTPLGETDTPRKEPCQRMPDGVLLSPNVNATQAKRKHAHAFLENKSGQEGQGKESSSSQLMENVRLAFGAQPNRRFVLGLSLVGASLRLWRFDRSGVLQSEEINIHCDARSFLHILCGFAFASDAILGYDPTYSIDSNGLQWIRIDDQMYEILKILHLDGVIRGRGTVCLRVRGQDGKENIVKESWVDVSRLEKEHELLEKSRDIEGIAHLIVHEIVTVDGVKDSTQIIRDKLKLNLPKKKRSRRRVEVREHHRLLLKECGLPLSQFATRRELITVLIDVIRGGCFLREMLPAI
jgi:hypothetical protein